MDIIKAKDHSRIETIIISANGASQNLVPSGQQWKGYYIAQVHLLASDDDAMTFTLNAHNGAQIGTTTTVAATSGEFMPFNAATSECRYLTGNPKYTLADMSAGTLTVEVVLVK